MKRILKGLKNRFSRLSTATKSGDDRSSESTEGHSVSTSNHRIENTNGAKRPVHADDKVSGDSSVMPDIYAENYAATVPDLKVLDLRSPGVDESSGFNPYDTGVLQKKPGSKPR